MQYAELRKQIEQHYVVEVRSADRCSIVLSKGGQNVAVFLDKDRDKAMALAAQFALQRVPVQAAPVTPHEGASLVDDAPDPVTIAPVEATRGAKKLAKQLGIDVNKVPHEGKKITQPDVQKYYDALNASDIDDDIDDDAANTETVTDDAPSNEQ